MDNPEKSTFTKKKTPEKKPKETVGKIVHDMLSKETGNEEIDLTAVRKEAQKPHPQQLYDAVEDGKKVFPADFFLEVITIDYKAVARTINTKIIIRKTAPTPTHDSTAYHYHRLSDHLEYLWTVPCKIACDYFQFYALEIQPEEHKLRDFVLEFLDGTLLRRCKKLNNEKADSNRLIKR